MRALKSQTPVPALRLLQPARKEAGSHAPVTRLWRAALLSGCLAAAVTGLVTGDPSAYLQADPELARVLRGMALIKAALVLLAVAAVFWRCDWPLSRRVGAGYLTGIALMALATGMIWQLTQLAAAAGLFHLGMFLLLGVAYLDQRGPGPALRRDR